jgi:hypothetical protein
VTAVPLKLNCGAVIAHSEAQPVAGRRYFAPYLTFM